MLPLDFTEDDVTWVALKISGAAGVLGAEAIYLHNWLIRFGCASGELRFVVSNMAGYIANSYPPWADYCSLMSFCILAMGKSLGVIHLGIG